MEKRFWLEYETGGVIGFPVQEFSTREACEQHLAEKRAGSEYYPDAVVCEGEWGRCSECNSIISTRPLENYERSACEGGLCPNCRFGYRVVRFSGNRVIVTWFLKNGKGRVCRTPLMWMNGGATMSVDFNAGSADWRTMPLASLPLAEVNSGAATGSASGFRWQGEVLPMLHYLTVGAEWEFTEVEITSMELQDSGLEPEMADWMAYQLRKG